MRRPLLVTCWAPLTFLACGATAPATVPAAPPAPPEVVVVSREPTPDAAPSLEGRRRIGQWTRTRYSGARLAEALVVTETVVAREGVHWVLELQIESERRDERYRVWLDDAEVPRELQVWQAGAWVTEGVERYQALQEELNVAPDANLGERARKAETCLVGEQAEPCELVHFDVLVDGEPAALEIAQSPRDPARELSGELRAATGELLYRAERLEEGQHGPGLALRD